MRKAGIINVHTRITVNPIKDDSNQIAYMAVVIRDITAARTEMLNDIKLNVVKMTLESVNDLILNYMNQLLLFRMDCEETPNFSGDTLKEFDDNFNETLKKLNNLNNILICKEEKLALRLSVINYPHQNNVA